MGFSDDQFAFLAVLDAFGGPISIEVTGILAPLLPGPLFDLLGKTESQGWLIRDKQNRLTLRSELPPEIRARLDALNTPKRLRRLLTDIAAKCLDEKIGREEMLRLLEKADRIVDAGAMEIDLAWEVMKEGRSEDAIKMLLNVVTRLGPLEPQEPAGRLFCRAILALSNLCYSLGRDFEHLGPHLEQAQRWSRQFPDRRAWALIKLHIGRLHFFSDQYDQALGALSMGAEEIRKISDDDLSLQAAVFIGLFHSIKGQYREALPYFDRAEKVLETDLSTILTYPSAPLFLGFVAAYLGHFHQAIGCLDFNWRQARDSKNKALASIYQATLGVVLAMLHKHEEAFNHLEQAEAAAEACGSVLGQLIAKGSIAHLHFIQGRIEKAYESMIQATGLQSQTGLRHFSQPWIVEIIYEFHRLGFEPVPDYAYPELIARLLEGHNIHLKGVAHRLCALEKMGPHQDQAAAEKSLRLSRQCLEASGDPVELSKTLFEMARLRLRQGDKAKARDYIMQARHDLGGYADEFFPDEFRSPASGVLSSARPQVGGHPFLSSYLDMIESLYPSEDLQDIQSKILANTSRMFGAERSGLFWFPEGQATAEPKLSAAINLTSNEVASAEFRNSLETVLRTQETNQPQRGGQPPGGKAPEEHPIHSVLCIPLKFQEAVHGVLYFDNSYLEDAFGFIDDETMTQIIRHTNIVIERRMHFLKIKEQVDLLTAEKSARMALRGGGLLARSAVMKRLLEQADQVAATESTVLILGETGTGKELLANRIHLNSKRREGPNIIVDSTTIPENLMESELFGHEKGAFTGADRRKFGRIEMANRGTLFLDEIGELPLSAQAKLLRALQEKTFIRVGGTRTLKSDFRLVAATNRDLAAEVEAGRFREDLYFRLNVIPLVLPPLRQRSADIDLLAEHFLQRYAARYQRTGLDLSPIHKKMLHAYPWPGNIRELKNVMERAVLLSGKDGLELSLSAQIRPPTDHPFADTPSFEEIQRRYIGYILKKTDGKVEKAAELLGMKRTSLYTRMRILRMKR